PITQARPARPLISYETKINSEVSSAPVEFAWGKEVITTPFPVEFPSWKVDWDYHLEGIDGVVGWPDVRNNILVFNPGERTVRAVPELPAETAGWLKLKVLSTDVFMVEIPETNGNVFTMIVDTGYGGGVALPPAQWQTWRTAHPHALVTTVRISGPQIGEGHYEKSQADEINLGPLKLTDVPVNQAAPLPMPSMKNYGGMLGLQALARFDLVVDGKNGVAYLRPRPPIAQAGGADSGNWVVADNVQLSRGVLQDISGTAKAQQGDYAGAIADFTLAIQSDPEFVSAYIDRGYAKDKTGDYGGAIADFTQAIGLQPDDVSNIEQRAGARFHQGDYA
ncbi:MAG: hypothetical protein ACRETL_14890, partial [Gammaproteobacteria bacterium]